MRRRTSSFGLVASLLILLPAVLLHARVFRLTGRAMIGTGVDIDSLGKRVYRTSMRINGGQAEVSVVACRAGNEGMRQILASNRSTPGDVAIAFAPGGEEATGLMVVVERTDASSGSLRRVPSRHALQDVPLMPGSRVTRFIRNEQSLTALETASADAPPREAIFFYQAAMKQAGWMQMFPVSDPDQETLLCFVKGADMCLVQVGSVNSDGETQLALLHKQGALK